MKNKFILLMLMGLSVSQVEAQEIKKSFSSNPFFNSYNTPYNVPPFHLIKNEHFKPAIEEGIKKQEGEIKAITNNKSVATFDNTILALENSGELLSNVSTVFYNLNSANTNEEIQKIATEVAPLLSAHGDNINLNEKLFARVKTVWEQKDKLKLNPEQSKLLEKTYKRFVRSGANLNEKDKQRLRELNSELAVLTLKFGQNILAETNSYELVINSKAELAGLSDDLIDAATATAKAKGKPGKWVITLSNSSVMPFLQYSSNRKLRQEVWTAYKNRCNNGNEFDNNTIAIRLASMRAEKAKLLGYKTHAHYGLEESMAKTPEKVMEFLNQLWEPALEKAKVEEAEIKQMMASEGIKEDVQPYDWRYYSEKIRKQKFDLDENELKPYFSLDAATQGVFMVCEKLYGLKFKELKDVPTYHNDATVWEVTEKDGKHVGVLYMDFHPRDSKRGGAWMTSYRPQKTVNGKRIAPVISIVCNFTKPTENAPALFTFDEVTTYFHEFGHALHGLLSDVTYQSLAGTSVSRDFVELPSQVMENWASDPEVLKMYAKHYKTGQVIPDELIQKLENAGTYGQGFATVEYLASAFLDMDFHTSEGTISGTANEFELNSMKNKGLINSIIPRHRATYFSHVFSGGYSAGYYSYIWSGVLDTDAFDQFKKTSLFNAAKANSFRKNILERGGTEEPMELYKKFRGAEPSIEPLLKKRGLDRKSK
ncbi:M3 family metallopeptidase [Flavobacterium lacus]|uniref:Peptidyl-dipeptidase Dcp n=1 Tax=Flavobacterium lacus TaxID=1353778 RepID=A0A328WYI4_9FLAO|nr:M3 family metallopeptidase [Flavobacterium lacus]RAR50335.1 peptidyl-dipeptidase Dcp [Flavobacterium lacus]